MLETFIFIGRSGCGKGTQADLMQEYIKRTDSEKREILYIETGELFRKFIKGKGYSSRLSREIDEKDERQSDFLACSMWGNILIDKLEDNTHIIFDGVARSFPEAVLISTAMRFYKRQNPTVVHINVSRQWSEEHLLKRKEGRADDSSVERIQGRLDWFDQDTLPAITYFKTTPLYKFIEVNGEQPIEKVHSDIISKLNDK